MTSIMDRYTIFKNLLEAAQYTHEHGWGLCSSRFVPDQKRLCPIGALYLKSKKYNLSEYNQDEFVQIHDALVDHENALSDRDGTLKLYIGVLHIIEHSYQKDRYWVPDSNQWQDKCFDIVEAMQKLQQMDWADSVFMHSQPERERIRTKNPIQVPQ